MNLILGFAAGNAAAGIIKWNGNTWIKTFPDYMIKGNSTTGITCNDDDACSQTLSPPMLNANYSSCRVKNETNATVHAVGFGPITSCSFATQTLQAVAECGNGSFFSSTNSTLLRQFYQAIAGEILQLTFKEQTAQTNSSALSTLYPDSYIKYEYTAKQNPYGLMINLEKKFDNNQTATFSIPSDTKVIDARAISYSGTKWTSIVQINNKTFYNLSKFNKEYLELGDPYSFQIPLELINASNSVRILTGLTPDNLSTSSTENKVIYLLVKNATAYSPITPLSEGCIWTIQKFTEENFTLKIPSGYNKTSLCFYQKNRQEYDPNDAIQTAAFFLLRNLDLDLDGTLEATLDPEDVQIDASEIKGLPYTWSTEVQIRTWS
jgi:hypothetical protein